MSLAAEISPESMTATLAEPSRLRGTIMLQAMSASIMAAPRSLEPDLSIPDFSSDDFSSDDFATE